MARARAIVYAVSVTLDLASCTCSTATTAGAMCGFRGYGGGDGQVPHRRVVLIQFSVVEAC